VTDQRIQELEQELLRRQQGGTQTQPADQRTQELQQEMANRQKLGDIGMDIVHSIPTGLRTGLEKFAGAAGDIAQMPDPYIIKAIELLRGRPMTPEELRQFQRGVEIFGVPTGPEAGQKLLLDTPKVQAAVEHIAGPHYQPRTAPGQSAERMSEIGIQGFMAPGSMMQRIAQALFPAIATEAVHQAIPAGSKYGPTIEAGTAALTSALSPGGFVRYGKLGEAESEFQKAVSSLKARGVPLTAGQQTGGRALKFAESELGGGKFDELRDTQLEKYTGQAMQGMGASPVKLAKPENLAPEYARIGNQFDTLALQTTLPIDMRLQNDLINQVQRYHSVAGNIAKGPEEIMNRLGELSQVHGGVLPGEAYQNIRSELGSMIDSADGPTQQTLIGMQEAIDDAVQRGITDPALKAKWQETRMQYRNFRVIERAIKGGGTEAALGQITPVRLRNAITEAEGVRSLALGRNPLTELANSGAAVLKDMPQSGTAARAAARAGPAALATGAGVGRADIGAIIGGGLMAPALVGRLLMSKDVQAMLGQLPPKIRAMIAAANAARAAAEAGQRTGPQ
jgi:hypothetical protein